VLWPQPPEGRPRRQLPSTPLPSAAWTSALPISIFRKRTSTTSRHVNACSSNSASSPQSEGGIEGLLAIGMLAHGVPPSFALPLLDKGVTDQSQAEAQANTSKAVSSSAGASNLARHRASRPQLRCLRRPCLRKQVQTVPLTFVISKLP
jgi:hypothetical protein